MGKKQKPLLVGYARVSTDEQRMDLQIDALKKAGVLDDNLHIETVSGSARYRPKLDLAIKDLREGDTFVVWRLDRLGRSLTTIMERIKQITEVPAKFRSLSESVDIDTPHGMFAIQLMGAVAELEKNLIRQRTKAGLAARVARGAKLGAPLKMTPAKIRECEKLLKTPGWSVARIAKHLKISTGSIYGQFPGGKEKIAALLASKRKVKRK